MLEYTGIRVRDLERSRRFYCEGLGLVHHRTGRMAAGGIWEELRDPESGVTLELNYYPDSPPYREGDELDYLGFSVEKIEPVVERLLRLGGKIRIPTFSEGGTRLVFLSDPDGVWVELSQSSAADVPPTSRSAD